jgi:ankyrin repeat protein
MVRSLATFACLLSSVAAQAQETKRPAYPIFDYDTAVKHELAPHRRTIPVDGVHSGSNQIGLELVVSPAGDVLEANANGTTGSLEFWPQLQGEVNQWRFTPFEKEGKPVTAQVEEYIDLVPPERKPTMHVAPPVLKPNSKVNITLERSGCMGSCPSYSVSISTEGVVFDGNNAVVAAGKHTDTVDPEAVRKIAKDFLASDFYSMNAEYVAGVTDNPTYTVTIAIDGKPKTVLDYVGQWVGMPAVIVALEDEVDSFARTQRWIEGTDGLVKLLRLERFDFRTFDAQVMLKNAALNGETATVSEFLQAGVPLDPLPNPKPTEADAGPPLEEVGWLASAANWPDTLLTLIQAGASKSDIKDKNLALINAADSGSPASIRALIAYGADPNVDLTKLIVTRSTGGMTLQGKGSGSVLIDAARSGNPEAISEILRYKPKVELRDANGRTALFAASEYRSTDIDGERVECVRSLVKAGADVNARDNDGNTPLHETFLTDVEEELLKLGADVNARNNDGETPIFTTYDDDAIPLFIRHGADLTLRNHKGETVMEAAKQKGPKREEALRLAMLQQTQH